MTLDDLEKLEQYWNKFPNVKVKREDLDNGYFCYQLINSEEECITSFYEEDYHESNLWNAKHNAKMFSEVKSIILLLIKELKETKNIAKN